MGLDTILFMNEKELRIRYIRVLEKFSKRTIALLKLSDFDFERFKARTLKNHEEMKKAKEVILTAPYLIALKNFIDAIIRSVKHHSDTFEKERETLLKEANLLQKEKNRNTYKKDKHKNQKFDDGY